MLLYADALMQVLFGFFGDDLNVEISLSPTQELAVKVPAFHVNAKELQDDDARVHELLLNPWAHKIRVKDFPKLLCAEPRYASDLMIIFLSICAPVHWGNL